MDRNDGGLSPQEELNRAEMARRILDDPLVQEALTTIRDAILTEWESAPVRDTEGRERLWTMFRLSKQFEAHLASMIETGKLASKTIADNPKKFGIFSR